MFIKQAYSKDFDIVKYLPIPIIFFVIMLINFAAVSLLHLDVESLMKQQVAEKGENRVFVETLMPLVIFFFALMFWIKFVHKRSIRSVTTSRPKTDWKRIGFSFCLWGIITVALTAIGYYAAPDNFVVNFRPVPFAVMAVLAIILIPLQTSFEEYLFRGYLMQAVGIVAKNRWMPLVVTSFFFGLLHAANPEVGKMGYILLVYYIGTGFFLGIITLMDEGIELTLGFHAANNLVTALLVTSDWSAFQTPSVLKDMSEPSAGFDILLPLILFYPLLLFIFSKKYKWSGWKEKLTGKIVPDDENTIDKIGENYD